jgi:ABC-type dipeptide/oligopeptide/nickel transport system ATPase component
MSALNPAISLRSHFVEAWSAHERRGATQFHSRLEQVLAEVQLRSDREFLGRRPPQISVGQAQRIIIALAVLHRPDILICDEPTSALDPVIQNEIASLLRRLNRSAGTALIYVSHDLISVLQLCSRIAVLDRGRLVESLPVEEVERARHPASVALLNALPVPARMILDRRTQIAASEVGAASLLELISR